MTKTRLIQAVCTVALLAAAPAAFAQTNTAPGAAGAGNVPNAPGAAAPSDTTTMSPAERMGSDHRMHHAEMGHTGRSMHSRADTSQDSAVDQLNDQSLQAARSGQAYNGGGSSGGMMSPTGSQSGTSGSMNDMSGGSMNSNGSMGSSGSMGGGMSNPPAR